MRVPRLPPPRVGRTAGASRSLGWRLAAPAAFAVAGLLFWVSAETADGHDLRSSDKLAQLSDLIKRDNEQNTSLDKQVQAMRAHVDALTRAQSDDERVSSAQARSDALLGAADLLPVTGPGVTVTLNDAPPGAVPKAGYPTPTGDDLVVHQQDLQGVVNALWAGGATAMRIMDQRVGANTAVRCVGNTLSLAGRVYSPPYRITALGDVSRLQRALDRDTSVGIYRQYVDAYGLGYQVETKRSLSLPPYSGSLDLRYARAGH